jgi:predicted DsbA family dithiol-disulfide isomerase
MEKVRITCFSDLLCIWAYIAQRRIDELSRQFGDDIEIENRFCSVFGDTASKIQSGWARRGGHEGFNRHLKEVAAEFPEVDIHPDLWLKVRPASSLGGHAFLKAVMIADPAKFADANWALRHAFFGECRDIGSWRVQCEVAEALDIDIDAVAAAFQSGEAFAMLAADYQAAERLHIEGSPSFVLNEGRQKLYGNVGYRVLEANVRELLRSPMAGEASWC